MEYDLLNKSIWNKYSISGALWRMRSSPLFPFSILRTFQSNLFLFVKCLLPLAARISWMALHLISWPGYHQWRVRMGQLCSILIKRKCVRNIFVLSHMERSWRAIAGCLYWKWWVQKRFLFLKTKSTNQIKRITLFTLLFFIFELSWIGHKPSSRILLFYKGLSFVL